MTSDARVGAVGGDEDRLPALVAVVSASPFPVVLLELATEMILAASQTAFEILSQGVAALGRSVEDFLVDPPTGGLELLQAGRLSGYEATRVVAAPDGERRVQVWVRALPDRPVRHVLTVFSLTDRLRAGLRMLDPADRTRVPVIGTADRTLSVDRISVDVETLLGRAADTVLHQSILLLVGAEQAPPLLLALAQSTDSGRGVMLRLPLLLADGGEILADMSIVPLSPAPSFAFALSEVGSSQASGEEAADHLLHSVCQIIDCTDTSRALAGTMRPVAGLEHLSTRELHVVDRLLDGDRVPAIAASLYLSQSTVRNHLSSVFAKLHVSSQQELILLLRQKKDGLSTR